MTYNSRHNPFAPIHKLDRVELALNLATSAIDGSIGLQVVGRAQTKRAALWTYHESFAEDVTLEKGYGIGDALSHIGLVVVQDRPDSVERLDFALKGGLAYGERSLF
uniref:Uncharacterized protein n=1 Tax=uncultured prokaryote TaxID=198431 RepID=A0A0H5Q8K7_9ZZZZ|nr:hypothetical protein [uncultured prokaryote]